MNKAQWYLKLTAENYKHGNPFATLQQEALKEKKNTSLHTKHLVLEESWLPALQTQKPIVADEKAFE